MTKLGQLEKQWLSLWERIHAQSDSHKVFLELVRRYAGPHRFHHALQHIQECLGELQKCRRIANNPEAIEMALWFHDTEDDEEQSAVLFSKVADEASLNIAFSRTVAVLILATKEHQTIDFYPDSRFVIDIDLAILGQPEERFKEYEAQIRQEHQDIPQETFATERIAVLESFLGRPRIYTLGCFRLQYEKQARENLASAIKGL